MLKLTTTVCVLLASSAFAAKPTALDRYVSLPDPNYKYSLVSTSPGSGFTTYVLEMTSQQWRSPKEVGHPVWKHWLTIVKPAKVESTTGFLYITGGSIGDKAPSHDESGLAVLATTTHTVAAELRGVPNEPLIFAGDGKKRSEDGIIAYSWDKYLRTGDDTWPARLPMTKAAVRALDTITAFCKDPAQGGEVVDKFVVSGGSKRGWAAWTTAAVDKRVIAVVPFVIDILNIEKSMEHHYRAYGFWAPSVGDYEKMGITRWAGTPQYRALMKIEEPYSYRDRLTMPKYIVNATGDEFFVPDSSQFYWSDLKGEKYLRYVPNAKHNLAGSDARDSLLSFYESVIKGTQRPKLAWKFEKDGGIRVKTSTKPSEVRLWQATNPKARDFRLDEIGKAYTSTVLSERSPGVYQAKADAPPKGYTAFFIEMTYPMGAKPMKVTTGVRVTPDTLPGGPSPRGPVPEAGQ